jgi:Flp pilus assembly pilin Flp
VREGERNVRFRWKRFHASEGGQTAVEYALLLCLCLVLVMTHNMIIQLITNYFYRISGIISSPFP